MNSLLQMQTEQSSTNPNNPEKLVYTVSELAKVLNIGMNSAYYLVNSKGFPKITLGRKILISKKSLENWILSTSQPTM